MHYFFFHQQVPEFMSILKIFMMIKLVSFQTWAMLDYIKQVAVTGDVSKIVDNVGWNLFSSWKIFHFRTRFFAIGAQKSPRKSMSRNLNSPLFTFKDCFLLRTQTISHESFWDGRAFEWTHLIYSNREASPFAWYSLIVEHFSNSRTTHCPTQIISESILVFSRLYRASLVTWFKLTRIIRWEAMLV